MRSCRKLQRMHRVQLRPDALREAGHLSGPNEEILLLIHRVCGGQMMHSLWKLRCQRLRPRGRRGRRWRGAPGQLADLPKMDRVFLLLPVRRGREDCCLQRRTQRILLLNLCCLLLELTNLMMEAIR